MDYLIVYDTTGYIVYQATGDVRVPVGIPSMTVTIPDGKRLVSMDVSVTPNVPVFEDIPVPTIEQLQANLVSTNVAVDTILSELIPQILAMIG